LRLTPPSLRYRASGRNPQPSSRGPQGGAGAPHPALRGLRCAAREAALPALTLCQTPLTWRAPAGAPAPTTPRVRAPRIVYAKGVRAHVRRAHMHARRKVKGSRQGGDLVDRHLACFVVHVTMQPPANPTARSPTPGSRLVRPHTSG
jgi:hypothetical protein